MTIILSCKVYPHSLKVAVIVPSHLLVWWSSSRVIPVVVMCHRDSDKARFSTITLMESMWRDSNWEEKDTERSSGGLRCDTDCHLYWHRRKFNFNKVKKAWICKIVLCHG